MPYRNADVQRQAKAASARRRRAEQRGTLVEPVVPTAEVTRDALYHAGLVLHCARADGESDDAYRDRLRAAWQALLSVVG